MVLHPRVRRLPRIAAIIALAVAAATRFIDTSRRVDGSRERMRIVLRLRVMILPGLSTIQRPHHAALLDACEEAARLVGVGQNAAHMMGLRLGWVTPLIV